MVQYICSSKTNLSMYISDILMSAWDTVPILLSDESYFSRVERNRDSIFFLIEDSNSNHWCKRVIEEFPNSLTVVITESDNVDKKLSENGKIADFYITVKDLASDHFKHIKTAIDLKQKDKQNNAHIRMLEETVVEWENVFRDSLDLIFIIDAETKKIVQPNKTATIVLGYSEVELIGMDFSFLSTNMDENSSNAEFHGASIVNQGLRSNSGKWIPMESTWRVFQKGQVAHIIATFRDISERKSAEEKIHSLAYYNATSQLPNRILFESELKEILSIVKSQQESLAVIVMDIDNFKLVNESLGSVRGDQLLKGVADRLVKIVSKKYFIGHFGGDEFGLVVRGYRNQTELESIILFVQMELRKPYQLEERELHITFSMGVALYPKHADGSAGLIKSADMAMYSSKNKGKNHFSYYSNKMMEIVQGRLEVENDLRRAIQAKEFEIYFQPQISIKTGELCGVEALIRWNHPQKGLVMPGKFIGVAEDTGLIYDIGLCVLEKSCQAAKSWIDDGLIDFPISVNISAKQWNGFGIAEDIKRVLAESQLPANFLTVELTESSIMLNPESSIAMFRDLVKMGVLLSVDDFGTGYSSLSYLKRLDVHHLKIDRSFIQDLVTNENDRAISAAIINMAHSLNLLVVAEGVEDHEQLMILREQGCDMIQGFYISRPIPEKEFEELLKRFRTLKYGVSVP
ncbi:putative bifunctional diguanylate cyclase/phosphodiesterase [Leptospira sp. GIMC2001]|uniref:putative bifunctional diguanylate cyclase/phosphodiesterase n=1 Tax=Leptospira sp. GIMC2001 TaxID=1513297 RepID=UPI00234B0CFA|nr:bifunctional diguanylate cyclase/phosphodiesterase [Leptospira sp. GIMC2001]WCL49397.1 bifunctional diguanylate cyclase/phosphodiesterase [Leptospira sp. GIMC2001]